MSDVPFTFYGLPSGLEIDGRTAKTAKTLRMARQIAMNAGIRYVYTGNVHDPVGQATRCHACGAVLIGRDQYDVMVWKIYFRTAGVLNVTRAALVCLKLRLVRAVSP